MLSHQLSSRHRRPPVDARTPSITAALNNPPVIIATEEKPNPHPIYGNIPMGRDGFALERQLVSQLAYWHEKADALIWADPTSDEVPELVRIQSEIFKAAMAKKPCRSADIAAKLTMLLRQLGYGRVESPDLVPIEDIAILRDQLKEATEPLRPTKRVTALQRGNKLTRAGLLHRYHAFLIGELETVGWNLYGCRDYALAMRPNDDEVNKRTQVRRRSGKSDSIFNDESTLPDRARAVLKSLKIETLASDVDRRPKHAGAR